MQWLVEEAYADALQLHEAAAKIQAEQQAKTDAAVARSRGRLAKLTRAGS